MAFTGKLGTSESQLGSVVLGEGADIAAAIPQPLVTDSTSVTESVSRAVALLRSAADSISTSETLLAGNAVPRSVSDTVSSSESATDRVGAARSATDAVSTSESVGRGTSASRTTADTTSVSDSVGVAGSGASLTRTATDTVAVGGAAYLNDDFAVDTLGSTWISDEGAAFISSGMLQMASNLSDGVHFSGLAAPLPARAEFEFKSTASSGGSLSYELDLNDFVGCTVRQVSFGQWSLRVSRGTANVFSNITVLNNEWYTLAIEVDGPAVGDAIRIKVWKRSDPEPVTWTLQTTNNAVRGTSGQITFWIDSGAGETISIDRVKVFALSGSQDVVARQIGVFRQTADTGSASDSLVSVATASSGLIADTTAISESVGRHIVAARRAIATTATNEAVRALPQPTRASDSTSTSDSVLPYIVRAADQTPIDPSDPVFQTSVAQDAASGATSVEVVSPGFNSPPITVTIDGMTYTVTAVNGTTWTLSSPTGVFIPAGAPVTYSFSGDGGNLRPILTQIMVAGLDMTRFVDFARSKWSTFGNGIPGTAEVWLKDEAHAVAIPTGSEMVVLYRGIRMWGGYVKTVSRGYAFPSGTGKGSAEVRYLTLGCVDYNTLFSSRIFYDRAAPTNRYVKHWPNGTMDSAVLAEVLSRYVDLSADGLSYDIRTVATPEISTKSCDPDVKDEFTVGESGWPLKPVMDTVADAVGAVYYIDPDKVLRYVDDATAQSKFGFTGLSDSPGGLVVGYRDVEIAYDGSDLDNDQWTWGVGQGSANPVLGHARFASSIAAHGLWQKGELRYDMYCQDSVNRRANTWVYGSPQNHRGHGNDKISVRCTVFVPYFRVSDVVQVSSTAHGFNLTMPIRGMEISFPTPWDIQCVIAASHEIDAPWSSFEQLFPMFDLDLPEIDIPRLTWDGLIQWPPLDPCYGPPTGSCLEYTYDGGLEPSPSVDILSGDETSGFIAHQPARSVGGPSATQGGYGTVFRAERHACEITGFLITPDPHDVGSEWPNPTIPYWYHFLNVYMTFENADRLYLGQLIADGTSQWYFESFAQHAWDGSAWSSLGREYRPFLYGPVTWGVSRQHDGSVILTCADRTMEVSGADFSAIEITSFISWWGEGAVIDIPEQSVLGTFYTAPSSQSVALEGGGGDASVVDGELFFLTNGSNKFNHAYSDPRWASGVTWFATHTGSSGAYSSGSASTGADPQQIYDSKGDGVQTRMWVAIPAYTFVSGKGFLDLTAFRVVQRVGPMGAAWEEADESSTLGTVGVYANGNPGFTSPPTAELATGILYDAAPYIVNGNFLLQPGHQVTEAAFNNDPSYSFNFEDHVWWGNKGPDPSDQYIADWYIETYYGGTLTNPDPCADALPGDLAEAQSGAVAGEQAEAQSLYVYSMGSAFLPNSTEVWVQGHRIYLNIEYTEDPGAGTITIDAGVIDPLTSAGIAPEVIVSYNAQPELAGIVFA